MSETVQNPNTNHPDRADLEAYRTGEAGPEVGEHAASCEECQRTVRELTWLANVLRGAIFPAVSVPGEVDLAMLAAIRRQTVRRRPVPMARPFSWPALVAAAALLLIGVGMWVFSLIRAPDAAPVSRPLHAIDLTRFSPGDVDYSGAVDILDAYQMARVIQTKGAVREGWDLNGDGRVDELDVAVVARKAVSVTKEDL